MARVALLVESGFEDAELFGTRDLLVSAACEVVIVGPFAGREYAGRRGGSVTSGMGPGTARSAGFGAIVIPGGHAPDRIRMRHAMLDLVRDAVAAGRPVAAIGHGPQVLISADVLRGRTLTCWPSIAVDVKNAGGLYVDRPVVVDGNVITARKSDDLSQFVTAILEAVG